MSSAYCTRTATVQLSKKTFGIYDLYLKSRLMRPYTEERYQLQLQTGFKLPKEAIESRGIIKFDSLVRSRLLGYRSTAHMHSSLSCYMHIHKVKVPVMFLHAKDDPIVNFSQVPTDQIKLNPNFFMALSQTGGHCEFYYTDRKSG